MLIARHPRSWPIQTEWKVCEKYVTSQLCPEGPTDRYVQYISKLDRKHCRMLVGLLTGHINLQHMLHKMRAKTPSFRRCGAEMETLVHILCECPVLEKVRIQTLGFARMNPEQIKEARLSGIVALGKGAGLLNSPYEFKWEVYGAMGQWAWVLGSQLGPTSQKKKKFWGEWNSATFLLLFSSWNNKGFFLAQFFFFFFLA